MRLSHVLTLTSYFKRKKRRINDSSLVACDRLANEQVASQSIEEAFVDEKTLPVNRHC
ncbi:hypothetical protein Pla22_14080 [Rubripirellula amarantea]|uniref:Uncharacterized protein n=1 Tax=Rubripirellula amarantea TaxID=2527999 RepID=A0A5C5WUX9_9BACT|nr:hypothetical protein Pla22_14080 [Rubripirellula amarantea]